MRELVYGPTKVEEMIKKKWPGAKIIDASDDIHHERFEAIIDDVSEETFDRFAIREGFALICLGLRCRMLEGDKEVEKWIEDELDKPEK